MRFIIISSGLNCKQLAKACIESVKRQTYNNYIAVFISDGSTDGTNNVLFDATIKEKNLHSEVYPDNVGAAKRRWNAITKYATNPEDVILLLGLDDALMTPNALQIIKHQYDHGKWMTYGNWRDNMGKMLPRSFDLDFQQKIHDARDYRKVAYRSTAPNTFKRFLFDQLTERDFIFEGKWVLATTESNLMFSCLEMCGQQRIGVIREPIYLYNRRGKFSTKEMRGAEYQNRVYKHVVSRDKKPLLIQKPQ